MSGCVLTVNGGSSSLKFALFAAGEPARRVLAGKIERIGLPDACLSMTSEDRAAESCGVAAPDHTRAVAALIERLDARIGLAGIAAVGHRVVHGGGLYSAPRLVTPELLDELRKLLPLDPLHLPGEIAMIEACIRHLPQLPHVACFDTAFHASMPRVAQLLPIPRHYESIGLRRYGFHGLSYTYLMEQLGRAAGEVAARGRIVLAHLGAGASMAAVRGGACVDTTMGFTPSSGLPMATRTGDLDPGVLLYLIRNEGLSAEQLDDIVNRRSGLLGISAISPDLRDLLQRRDSDVRAAEAVELFCYQARRWVGAFAATLGGLDTLVFAGGIGENAPEVRAAICEGLEFLGIALDGSRNSAGAALISTDASAVAVRVIHTDEEIVIARAVRCALQAPESTLGAPLRQTEAGAAPAPRKESE